MKHSTVGYVPYNQNVGLRVSCYSASDSRKCHDDVTSDG